MGSNILFTPAAILDLLSKLPELEDTDVGLVESDDSIQIFIGDSVYAIAESDATPIEVDKDVVDAVDDVNIDTYQQLADFDDMDVYMDSDADNMSKVQGGIIKQLAKTLAIGGLVRLTSKLLKK